jgi:hypothetical protein
VSISLLIERGAGTSKPFAAEMLQRLQRAIARTIARAYALAMPALAALALVGFMAAFVFRRARPEILTLAAACAVAVAARIALLAYLEVTSIPSVNLLYLSPAAPFFLCFVVLGLYCGVAAIAPRSRQSEEARP